MAWRQLLRQVATQEYELVRSRSLSTRLYSTLQQLHNVGESRLSRPHKSYLLIRSSSTLLNRVSSSDCRSPFGLAIGSTRSFSQEVAPLPHIKDSDIKAVFKDFIAADWGELPEPLIKKASKVLSKDSDDNIGKEALKNVFRAAEAAEEFNGYLETLKMAIDDLVGMSGENVKPLPEHYSQALKTAYDRYSKYLASFGPDEIYLKKKVESELGRRMIHLKMRCGGLHSEWGKVTVLGTSGISGSYVEQRAP